jgi:hypothetical protein
MRRAVEALMLHPFADASSAEGASTRDYHPWMMGFGDSESFEAQRTVQRAGRALRLLFLLLLLLHSILFLLLLLLHSLLFRLLTVGTGSVPRADCSSIAAEGSWRYVIRWDGHAWLAHQSICVWIADGHAWRTYCSVLTHPAALGGV